MIVELPNGETLELESPTLASLLVCGGNMSGIAKAVWADERVAATSARTEAIYAAAVWGLDVFAMTDEALDFAALIAPELPSVYLGIADRSLAWRLDKALRTRLLEPHDPVPAYNAPSEPPRMNEGAPDAS